MNKLNQSMNPAFLEELDKILNQIRENAFNLNYNDLKTLRYFTKSKYSPLKKNI